VNWPHRRNTRHASQRRLERNAGSARPEAETWPSWDQTSDWMLFSTYGSSQGIQREAGPSRPINLVRFPATATPGQEGNLCSLAQIGHRSRRERTAQYGRFALERPRRVKQRSSLSAGRLRHEAPVESRFPRLLAASRRRVRERKESPRRPHGRRFGNLNMRLDFGASRRCRQMGRRWPGLAKLLHESHRGREPGPAGECRVT
jgi:hypothetical protein